MSQVTIITVCHNSMGVLPDMLASIPADIPVVLVDNASDDISDLKALAKEHGAHLLNNPANKGFGTACNQGAAIADTEFLLFLNPDAQLATGALDALVAAARAYPDATAFNPQILNGRRHRAFRRGSKIRPAERLRGPVPTQDREVPVLSGSAIFVHRSAFEKIGGFDEAIFLYHEDDDLSLRLRDHGQLMYCHNAVVCHLEGRGTPRSPQSAAFKAFHMARSRVYAYAKHGHRYAKLTTLLTAMLRLAYPETLLSKRKRSKNWGFFKGALSAQKDGGRGHP